MADSPRTTPAGSLFGDRLEGASFTTTREELFERLILHTPHGFTVTEGRHGPGRKYHLTVSDLLDAFWQFCDEKEAEDG